jgi:hypothetical protein
MLYAKNRALELNSITNHISHTRRNSIIGPIYSPIYVYIISIYLPLAEGLLFIQHNIYLYFTACKFLIFKVSSVYLGIIFGGERELIFMDFL